MEPDDEFSRRAFGAAGPVFLVGLGLVFLVVALVWLLLVPVPSGVAWGLALLGAVGLLAGVAWGLKVNRETPREHA